MAENAFKTVSEALAPTPFTAPATRALVEQYGTPSVVEYENQIALRILELEHDIRVLKTCRNSNRPVNRLPVEVLSHIFLVLYRTVQTEVEEGQKGFWIYATHVCRHWRAVALGCAALWCDFAFDMNGELMRTILARSKHLPISVCLKCDWGTDTKALGEVLSHTMRIRHLDLSSWTRWYTPYHFVLARMGPCAPLLTTLRLSISYPTPMIERSLPEKFLRDGAPILKHLTLKNFDFHWARIPFPPTLTTLHLEQNLLVNKSLGLPNFAKMLETFRGLPLLEALTLDEIFPEDRFQPGMMPVTFSNLEDLTLTGRGRTIGNFLLGIRVPKSTFIDITFNDKDEWISEVDACVASIRELWRDDPLECQWAKDSLEFLDFTASANSHRNFAFGFHDKELYWEHDDPNHLNVNFLSSSPGNLDLVFLTFFKEQFNFDGLTTLDLTGNSQLACRPALEGVFAHLPKLDSISFWGCDVVDFLHILDGDPACAERFDSEEISTADPTFPALHSLEIGAQRFRGKRIDTIIRVLGKRPRGHRIGCLTIEDCINIDKTDAEKIRDALPDLHTFVWDGPVIMDNPDCLKMLNDVLGELEF
ncbi:hypothetical protein D9611_001287 [Ephemerocybe angulata]|uniref:F-box domain-containing protein n=1 Tax=Ephemerocybe angulata TaxID=980116 RepID=A0A8H5FN99_9AGAR|nr:hypothetical protein D9611_001287 [Tulosesus angulatus]